METVSDLLRSWGRGNLRARDRLIPLVYRDLRQRAAALLNRERRDHTLQPTALVHEAYLRLFGQTRVDWQNRAHFFGIAARMMRRVLVDHARERTAAKRRGAAVRVPLDDRAGAEPPVECEVLLLNQALEELAALDPRQAQIVELRYFGGMSEQEVAAALVHLAHHRHPRVADGASVAVPPHHNGNTPVMNGDPSRWDGVKHAFQAALDAPPAERAARRANG